MLYIVTVHQNSCHMQNRDKRRQVSNTCRSTFVSVIIKIFITNSSIKYTVVANVYPQYFKFLFLFPCQKQLENRLCSLLELLLSTFFHLGQLV